MTHSIIEYPGVGTAGPFAINFTLGFLSRDHVTAHIKGDIDGLGNQVYLTLEWLTDSLVNVSEAVPYAKTLVISRDTPVTQTVHDYQDNAVMDEKSLDESFLQSIMLMQEVIDGKQSSQLRANLDANHYFIKNLLDGVDAQDAATVAQVNEAKQLNLDAIHIISQAMSEIASINDQAAEIQSDINEIRSIANVVSASTVAIESALNVIQTTASNQEAAFNAKITELSDATQALRDEANAAAIAAQASANAAAVSAAQALSSKNAAAVSASSAATSATAAQTGANAALASAADSADSAEASAVLAGEEAGRAAAYANATGNALSITSAFGDLSGDVDLEYLALDPSPFSNENYPLMRMDLAAESGVTDMGGLT